MKRVNLLIKIYCVFFLVWSLAAQDEANTEVEAEAADDTWYEIAPEDLLPDELPEDLYWETNNEDPEYASPDAVQGGTFHMWMRSFPDTLRPVGPNSNGSFASVLRPLQMGPVALHANTRQPIPMIATHWALGDDGRSFYFRIHPDARWSDGERVTADDFVFTLRFMRSKKILDPWYNNYYTERVTDVKKYDELTYGVRAADAKPYIEMLNATSIRPYPEHFHELSDDWVREFSWKAEPTTGAYHVSVVEKGKYVELARTENWWANELQYLRNRFNPEKIRITVLGDMNTAWLHFLAGELDSFGLTIPEFWHDKTDDEAFKKGYIAKYWYYHRLPVPAAGLSINTAMPLLDDKNIRYGLAHSMNIQWVIDTELRGDYERLPTFQLGFGAYDNTSIKPRQFDHKKAKEYFEKAGFVDRDRYGIRVKKNKRGRVVARLSFSITYGRQVDTDQLVLLKEEAKKAGVELKLDLMDWTASFAKMQEKKHQIAWLTWNSSGLSPRYWEFFHSVNANKTDNNNVTNTSIPEMDPLIMKFRASTNLEERINLAHTLEQMVHDHGAIIPTYQVPYTRQAMWRWIELPDRLGTETSGSLANPFASSQGYSSGGLFWINEDKKKEILAMKAKGEAMEPLTIIDRTYRIEPDESKDVQEGQ
ncbi:MAG: ABC transporter substrate-binding protein [Gammaproteobacteria bacterium]|nr:ABC transporter substrate-binding protein [Gammaproteobacteria bacterium]